MLKHFAVTFLAVVPAVVAAQTVSSISVAPASIRAGESAKITVQFDVTGSINCGLRLHFGDGQTSDYKINQDKDVPLIVSHTYGKAGNLTVKAEPKRNGMILGCLGKNQETTLTVNASGQPSAKGVEPQCPDAWSLDKKSVNKKSGAFVCKAKAGTEIPASKLACPSGLGYFETQKTGTIGCK